MKRMIALFAATGLFFGAFAQTVAAREGHIARPPASKTTVIVVPGGGFYSPYYYGYSRYGFYPYGGYYSMYGFAPQAQTVPTKLDLEVEQIRNDYHHQIADVRHDKSISKEQRKQKIRDIKHERENAIITTKRDYYSSPKNSN